LVSTVAPIPLDLQGQISLAHAIDSIDIAGYRVARGMEVAVLIGFIFRMVDPHLAPA
jgi:hypothetical protein